MSPMRAGGFLYMFIRVTCRGFSRPSFSLPVGANQACIGREKKLLFSFFRAKWILTHVSCWISPLVCTNQGSIEEFSCPKITVLVRANQWFEGFRRFQGLVCLVQASRTFRNQQPRVFCCSWRVLTRAEFDIQGFFHAVEGSNTSARVKAWWKAWNVALKLVLQKPLFCILAGDDCFAYIAASESVYFWMRSLLAQKGSRALWWKPSRNDSCPGHMIFSETWTC